MKKRKIFFLLGGSILTLIIRFPDIWRNNQTHFSLIGNVVIENVSISLDNSSSNVSMPLTSV